MQSDPPVPNPPGVPVEGTVVQSGDKVVTVEDLTFLAGAAGVMLIGQNKPAPFTRRPQAIDLRQPPDRKSVV